MKIPIQRKLINNAELQEVINRVHFHGAQRKKLLGRAASDASYVAGIGAVFEALGMWNDMPPAWLMPAMSGRPIFNEPAPKVPNAR